jgi:hypothetical protein
VRKAVTEILNSQDPITAANGLVDKLSADGFKLEQSSEGLKLVHYKGNSLLELVILIDKVSNNR